MKKKKLRIGLVGLQAGRSWAALAHLPALYELSDLYEIVGVVNSSLESSQAAAEACAIPHAFGSIDEMAASEDIDLVVVTVRVPLHYDAVKSILSHGKHVYCEWPLGRTLAEAEELAAMARERSVVAVAGTQARVSPAIRTLSELIKANSIGSIVSSSIHGWATPWGATISDTKNEEYLRKQASGADLLTIPFAHTLAAARDVLGSIRQLSATVHTRYPRVKALDTGTSIEADASDYISVIASLTNGAPLSMEYTGGHPVYGDAFSWQIEGTTGQLVMTGSTGHTQLANLAITRYSGFEQEPAVIEIAGMDHFGPHTNVKEIYRRLASDILKGTHSAPSFEEALSLHKLIEDIRLSSRTGQRISPASPAK